MKAQPTKPNSPSTLTNLFSQPFLTTHATLSEYRHALRRLLHFLTSSKHSGARWPAVPMGPTRRRRPEALMSPARRWLTTSIELPLGRGNHFFMVGGPLPAILCVIFLLLPLPYLPHPLYDVSLIPVLPFMVFCPPDFLLPTNFGSVRLYPKTEPYYR